MPPRIPLQSFSSVTKPQPSTIPSFLVPFLHIPARHASILSNLSDTPGAYKKSIRLGRGPSSGKGKTSGRGQKGQKARGKAPKGFNGGQTSEDISHGHYGFKNMFVPPSLYLPLSANRPTSHTKTMSPINLERIQSWITQGRLNPSKPITLKELSSTRALHGVKDGVKLLARGSHTLTHPINIVVSRASAAAISAVEAAGGSVTTRYYTPYAIARIKQGKSDPYVSLKWEADKLPAPLPVGMGADPKVRVKGNGFQYRLPDPTSRKDIEYYRDPKKRGYLSHVLKEGETPSLFFRPPVNETIKEERAKAKREAESNKLF